MKIFFVIGSIILVMWSVYDFIKIFLLGKKYEKDSPAVCFTATPKTYVFVGVGILLCAICFGVACMDEVYWLMLLGAACLSGASREFIHSYFFSTERFVIMNGRRIACEEIEQYGRVRKMGILSFLNIFEVCTKQYREYVYVKEGFEYMSHEK